MAGGHLLNRLPSSHVRSPDCLQGCPSGRIQHQNNTENWILYVSQPRDTSNAIKVPTQKPVWCHSIWCFPGTISRVHAELRYLQLWRSMSQSSCRSHRTSSQTATNEFSLNQHNPSQGGGWLTAFGFFFNTKCLFFILTVDVWGSTECCLILEYTGNGTFCFTSASDTGIQLVRKKINALC